MEYDGLRALFSYLCKVVKLISSNNVKADVPIMYEREKVRLVNLLHFTPGRMSLIYDHWTIIARDGYLKVS